MAACGDVQARLTAHVKAPRAALVASTTTVCWRDVCADLVATSDAGNASQIAFDARRSLLDGDATVFSEGKDGSRLEIVLRQFTRARDGDYVYARAANGDRYRVTVVAADGTKLFDAEKTVTYDEYYPNGADCDPEPCRRVAIELEGGTP